MENLNFNRFKKKSLILLAMILDISLDLIDQIKLKKLKSCITTAFHRSFRFEPKVIPCENQDTILKLNGTQLAIANNCTLEIWDLVTGKIVNSLNGHLSTIMCIVKISKNKIATSCVIGLIKFWTLPSGTCYKTLNHKKDNTVSGLCFLNSNELVTVAERNIHIWNIDKSAIIKTIAEEKSAFLLLYDLVLNKNQICTYTDNHFKIWNVKTYKMIRKVNKPEIYSMQKYIDQQVIILYKAQNNMMIYDFKTETCLLDISPFYIYIVFKFNRFILLGNQINEVKVYELKKNKLIEVKTLLIMKDTLEPRFLKKYYGGFQLNGNQFIATSWEELNIANFD